MAPKRARSESPIDVPDSSLNRDKPLSKTARITASSKPSQRISTSEQSAGANDKPILIGKILTAPGHAIEVPGARSLPGRPNAVLFGPWDGATTAANYRHRAHPQRSDNAHNADSATTPTTAILSSAARDAGDQAPPDGQRRNPPPTRAARVGHRPHDYGSDGRGAAITPIVFGGAYTPQSETVLVSSWYNDNYMGGLTACNYMAHSPSGCLLTPNQWQWLFQSHFVEQHKLLDKLQRGPDSENDLAKNVDSDTATGPPMDHFDNRDPPGTATGPSMDHAGIPMMHAQLRDLEARQWRDRMYSHTGNVAYRCPGYPIFCEPQSEWAEKEWDEQGEQGEK